MIILSINPLFNKAYTGVRIIYIRGGY